MTTTKPFTDDPLVPLVVEPDGATRAEADQDKLGRAPFAMRVAEVVSLNAGSPSSTVMGLVGPWGSGKTSLLNYVHVYVEDISNNGVHRVSFSPWFATDLEGIVSEFYATLREVLPDDGNGRVREVLSSMAEKTRSVGRVLSLVGVPLADTGADILSEMLKLSTPEASSLRDEHDTLSELLMDLHEPVLLTVDDVDRLPPEQLLLTFQMIRLTGRLPFVHYLLAFDEETVLSVLSKTDFSSGDSNRALKFLDKVVQIRFDIPPVHEIFGERMFTSGIESIRQSRKVVWTDSDEYRMSELYYGVFSLWLDTPRSILRFLNQVDSMYSMVADEVDFVDFVAVTSLRVFSPDLYRAVMSSKPELTRSQARGPSWLFLEDFGKSVNYGATRDWDELTRAAGSNDPRRHRALLALIGLTFPKLSAKERGGVAIGRIVTDSGQRIGLPEYFDRYFQFGIPPGDVPDSRVQEIVEKIVDDPIGLGVDFAGDINWEFLLAKIQRIVDFSPHICEPLFRYLLVNFDALPRGESEIGHIGEPRSRARYVMSECLTTRQVTFSAHLAPILARGMTSVQWMALGFAVAAAQRRARTPGSTVGLDSVEEQLRTLLPAELDRQLRLPLTSADTRAAFLRTANLVLEDSLISEAVRAALDDLHHPLNFADLMASLIEEETYNDGSGPERRLLPLSEDLLLLTMDVDEALGRFSDYQQGLKADSSSQGESANAEKLDRAWNGIVAASMKEMPMPASRDQHGQSS